MKFSAIIIFILSCVMLELSATESAGMTAYREGNFDAASRILSKETDAPLIMSKEYFERVFAYIESLLHISDLKTAQIEMDKIRQSVPNDMQIRFKMLEAQARFIKNELKNCENILTGILKEKNLNSKVKYDAVTLLSCVYLADGRAQEALKIISEAINAPSVAAHGEMQLKLLELRALATAGSLNPIPAKLNHLKTKFPAQQGKLQHFELLLHAINQNLPEYNKLFKKIFPDEQPLRAFIGDAVLYQGALLAEQQAQKEKNNAEIAFHLKNQTYFAPNDELRVESSKNLIKLYITINRRQDALTEVKSMLKSLPNINDRIQWEMIMADLMNSLRDGDLGLQTYLKIKNNTAAAPDLRAKAAAAAAEILKKQNRKSEMLKLYAFLADFPNSPAINDMGIMLTGKYYFENKEYRMGESILSRIAPDSANYPEALIYLIQCKINNGELDAAIQDVRHLTMLKDINDDSLPELSVAAEYFSAIIAELQKKEDEAAAMFEKIARQGSKHSGGAPLIINSWLKAAELYFKRQTYTNAGLLFLTFAEQYPKHPSGAEAFYKSVYSYFLAGRFDEMQYSIEKLQKSYPEHKLTVNALFHKVDHLRETDRMQDALKILDEISRINGKHKNNSAAVQIIYDRAVIFYQLQQFDNAVKYLEELKKLPITDLSAEGMFLAGTIYADQGEQAKSADCYLAGASMRTGDPLFNAVCRGRAADNFFILGSKTKDEKILTRAANIYNTLVKEKLPADFKLQCFYKLGRTLENLNDFQGALDAYVEALYLPGTDGRKNAVIPVWINKSAFNAINIYLRLGGSNSLNDAVFIIRRLKKLNTMTDQELEDLEYNVRERYINND